VKILKQKNENSICKWMNQNDVLPKYVVWFGRSNQNLEIKETKIIAHSFSNTK